LIVWSHLNETFFNFNCLKFMQSKTCIVTLLFLFIVFYYWWKNVWTFSFDPMFPSVLLPSAIQVVGCVSISHTFKTFEIISFKACVEDYHHNNPCSQCSPKFVHYVVHILDNCPQTTMWIEWLCIILFLFCANFKYYRNFFFHTYYLYISHVEWCINDPFSLKCFNHFIKLFVELPR